MDTQWSLRAEFLASVRKMNNKWQVLIGQYGLVHSCCGVCNETPVDIGKFREGA